MAFKNDSFGLSCSGVMFTLDTESGFRDTVLINGSWGLGEMIVQGEVTPDEFLIFKKTLGKSPNAIISKKLGIKNQKMIYSEGKGVSIKNTKIINASQKKKKNLLFCLIRKFYNWQNGAF